MAWYCIEIEICSVTTDFDGNEMKCPVRLVRSETDEIDETTTDIFHLNFLGISLNLIQPKPNQYIEIKTECRSGAKWRRLCVDLGYPVRKMCLSSIFCLVITHI